jgi:hypothetical protein
VFIAADRRNGKDKLQKKFVDFTNKGIKKVLEKRFNEQVERKSTAFYYLYFVNKNGTNITTII